MKHKISYRTICFWLGIVLSVPFILLMTIEFFSINDSLIVSLLYITLNLLFIGFVPAYNMLILDSMSEDATKSLSEFYSILDVEAWEYKEKFYSRYKWKISDKHLWIIIFVFFIIDIVICMYMWVLYNAPSYIFPLIVDSFMGIALLLPYLFAILTLFFVFYKTTIILHGIYKLKKQPIRVNVLNLYPLFSLSRLTQRLSLYLIPLIAIFGMWGVFILLTTSPASPNVYNMTFLPFFILTSSFLILFSACVFMLPVIWVRDLIRKKKKEALINITAMLTKAFNEHDHLVAADNLSGINELVVSINALQSRFDVYRKISESPWETQTLAKYIASVLVPMIIWIAQYLLTQLLNNSVK